MYIEATKMVSGSSISIFEVVGNPLCVASGDGEKVFNCLFDALSQGQSVSLSFLHVTTFTPAFLNVAVGQLYGNFDEEHIRKHLTVTDIEPDDIELLKRVIDSAKRYFQDPEKHEQAFKEELGIQDDSQ